MTKLTAFASSFPDPLWNLLLIAAAIVAGLLLKYLLIPLLRGKAIHEGQYSFYRSSVRHLSKVVNVLLPAVFFNSLIPAMRLTTSQQAAVSKATEILLIGCVAIVLIRIVRITEDYIYHRFDTSKADNLRERKIRTQIHFIRQFIIAVIVLVTTSIILLSFESMQKIGTGLLTGVGLGGIIIGFAAQKSLGNLLAGFQIALYHQPIRMDDVLVVEGEWGRVEEITLTYVVLNIWDKRRLILPIQYFIENPFQNWTRTTSEILGVVFIYTDYTLPVAPVRAELDQILKASPLWDGGVSVLQVTDLKEQNMELRALMSCRNSGEAFDLRCTVRESLLDFIRNNYPDTLPKTRVQLERG